MRREKQTRSPLIHTFIVQVRLEGRPRSRHGKVSGIKNGNAGFHSKIERRYGSGFQRFLLCAASRALPLRLRPTRAAVQRATTTYLDSISSSTFPTKGTDRTMSSARLLSQGRRKANADSAVDMEQDSSEEEAQQQRRQTRGGNGASPPAGGANDDYDEDDDDDDDDSSSSDGDPESMQSKTKTLISSAKAAATARGNKAQQPSRQTSDAESFGKRKADDFLRRQELAMDPRFKSTVVLPGDDVTESTTRTTRSLRLGPGLMQKEEKVLATRAGMLRYRPPCSYWVESNGRRYSARVEDQVMGVVEDRMGELYKVNIFGRWYFCCYCYCYGDWSWWRWW